MQEIINRLLELSIQEMNDESVDEIIGELNDYFKSIKIQGENAVFEKAEFLLYELCKLLLQRQHYVLICANLNLLAEKLKLRYYPKGATNFVNESMHEKFIEAMRSINPLSECISSNFLVVDKEHIRKNLACFRIIKILNALREGNSFEKVNALCVELTTLFREFFADNSMLDLQEQILTHLNDPENNNQLREFQGLSLPELEKTKIALAQFSERAPNDITNFLNYIVKRKSDDPKLVTNEVSKKISDIFYYSLEAEDGSNEALSRNIEELEGLLSTHSNLTPQEIIAYYKSSYTLLEKFENLLELESTLSYIPMEPSSKALLLAIIDSQKKNPVLIGKFQLNSILEIVDACHQKSKEKILKKLGALDDFLQNNYSDQVPSADIFRAFQKQFSTYNQLTLVELNTIFEEVSKIDTAPSPAKELFIQVIDSARKNPNTLKKHVYDSIGELFESIRNCKLGSKTEKIKIKNKLNNLEAFVQENFPGSLSVEMTDKIMNKIQGICELALGYENLKPSSQSFLFFMNKISNITSKINPLNPSAPSVFIQMVNTTKAALIVDIIKENYLTCKRELEEIYQNEQQDLNESFSDFIIQIESPVDQGNFFCNTFVISPKLESAIKNYKVIEMLSPVLYSEQNPIEKLKAIKKIHDLPQTQNNIRSSAETPVAKFFKKIGYYLTGIFSNNYAQGFLTPQKRFNTNTHKILECALTEGVIRNNITPR